MTGSYAVKEMTGLEQGKGSYLQRSKKLDIKISEFDERVRKEGRILVKDDVMYLSHSASAISFFTDARVVEAVLTTDTGVGMENLPGIRVYVDGRRKRDIILDRAEACYRLASPFDGRKHLITVLKITEAAMSHVGIKELKLDRGELLKGFFPEKNGPKLLFFGDSITCGYGVLGGPNTVYTVRDEDVTKSYAYIAAKLLNSPLQIIAASGHGMYVDYLRDRERNVPVFFPVTAYHVDREAAYDFSEFVPDVCVINLGTNDGNFIKEADVAEGYNSAYKKLVYDVRKAYPEVRFLFTIGTVCDVMYDAINRVEKELKAEGIEDIHVLFLPFHDEENDGVTDGHPSPITQYKDGERVAEFIKSIL